MNVERQPAKDAIALVVCGFCRVCPPQLHVCRSFPSPYSSLLSTLVFKQTEAGFVEYDLEEYGLADSCTANSGLAEYGLIRYVKHHHVK